MASTDRRSSVSVSLREKRRGRKFSGRDVQAAIRLIDAGRWPWRDLMRVKFRLLKRADGHPCLIVDQMQLRTHQVEGTPWRNTERPVCQCGGLKQSTCPLNRGRARPCTPRTRPPRSTYGVPGVPGVPGFWGSFYQSTHRVAAHWTVRLYRGTDVYYNTKSFLTNSKKPGTPGTPVCLTAILPGTGAGTGWHTGTEACLRPFVPRGVQI